MKKPYLACIDVTYRCTLRCKHCYNFSGDNGIRDRFEMTREELVSLSREIAYLFPHTVCFCGGEPLLRFNDILECINTIREINSKMKVNMVTNGELLTKMKAQKLAESGISMIQVSLDGGTAQSHDWLRNKEGAFDNAVHAIRVLDETRKMYPEKNIKICVAFCPNTMNKLEVEKAMDFCESLGVDYFRIQPMMIIGRAKRFLQDFVLSDIEYQELLHVVNNRRNFNLRCNKMGVEWGDPIDHLVSDEKVNYPTLAINAYGDILVSPYLPLSVGNVKRHTLSDYIEKGLLDTIWDNELVEYMSHKILTPEKMDVSDKIDVPELMHGYVEFDFLAEDFDIKTNQELVRLLTKEKKNV